jgi:hypothetical protein
MEKKIFKEFEIEVSNKLIEENPDPVLAGLIGGSEEIIKIHKVTLDLCSVIFYRQISTQYNEASKPNATMVELLSGAYYTLNIRYRDFDKIMRENFPESFK